VPAILVRETLGIRSNYADHLRVMYDPCVIRICAVLPPTNVSKCMYIGLNIQSTAAGFGEQFGRIQGDKIQ